jgi:hypothetical protein
MNRKNCRTCTTLKAKTNRDRISTTPDFRLRPTIVGIALMAMVATVPSVNAARAPGTATPAATGSREAIGRLARYPLRRTSLQEESITANASSTNSFTGGSSFPGHGVKANPTMKF